MKDYKRANNCPECGTKMIHTGGCYSCPSCGTGRCGFLQTMSAFGFTLLCLAVVVLA